MKKSRKLNLNELKVKSFVTDLEKGKENTIKGGENGQTHFHDCRLLNSFGNITDCSFVICD